MAFLEVGRLYAEIDYEGYPSSLFKYVGLVDRWNSADEHYQEHEFQCVEFDCEDEFQYYHADTPEDQFKQWFVKQIA